MTLDNIYKLITEFIKAYPNQNHSVLMPQTFSTIQSASDLNTENLGKTTKDRNKPYFYSKKWHRAGYSGNVSFDYPIITSYQSSSEINQVNLQIMVLDMDNEAKKGDSYAKMRTTDEVFRDTRYIMVNLLDYLNHLSQGMDNYFHELGGTSQWSRNFKRLNRGTEIRPFSAGTDNLKGYEVTLVFPIDDCLIFNPSYPVDGELENYPDNCC